MSELYQTYESEFVAELDIVKKQLTRPSINSDMIKQIRGHLSECQRNIKLMETEVYGQPDGRKSQKNTKLKAHKKAYDQLKKQIYIKQSNLELETQKKQLMGTRPSSSQVISSADRTVQVNQHLKDSVRLMYENLQIDQSVNRELKSQSNRMISNKDKLVEIRHDLTKGQRKIKSMMARARKNKFIVRGVLAFLVILALVLIVSWFK